MDGPKINPTDHKAGTRLLANGGRSTVQIVIVEWSPSEKWVGIDIVGVDTYGSEKRTRKWLEPNAKYGPVVIEVLSTKGN